MYLNSFILLVFSQQDRVDNSTLNCRVILEKYSITIIKQ